MDCNDFIAYGSAEKSAGTKGTAGGIAGAVPFFLLFQRKRPSQHCPSNPSNNWGVFERPLTLILLQKHRDTNGRRVVMRIGVCIYYFLPREGHLFAKASRKRNLRCIVLRYFAKKKRGQGLMLKIILTTPIPHICKKICPQNMPYNGGLHGIKVG